MTVKKLALLGVASMATLGMSLSMAGGPATCAPTPEMSGVYVGVDVGAFYNDTVKFNVDDHATNTVLRSKNHVPWGWSLSGLVGYQFNTNWGVQFGYIWNQDQKSESAATTSATSGMADKFQSWNLYLALKGMLPVADQWSLFAMGGVAYTSVTHKANTSHTIGNTPSYTTKATASWLSPMGALGVQYNLDQNFSLNVQYMYIMDKLSSTAGTTSKAVIKRTYAGTQRITLGANYLFTM